MSTASSCTACRSHLTLTLTALGAMTRALTSAGLPPSMGRSCSTAKVPTEARFGSAPTKHLPAGCAPVGLDRLHALAGNVVHILRDKTLSNNLYTTLTTPPSRRKRLNDRDLRSMCARLNTLTERFTKHGNPLNPHNFDRVQQWTLLRVGGRSAFQMDYTAPSIDEAMPPRWRSRVPCQPSASQRHLPLVAHCWDIGTVPPDVVSTPRVGCRVRNKDSVRLVGCTINCH